MKVTKILILCLVGLAMAFAKKVQLKTEAEVAMQVGMVLRDY
jgi:hypothetical protein